MNVYIFHIEMNLITSKDQSMWWLHKPAKKKLQRKVRHYQYAFLSHSDWLAIFKRSIMIFKRSILKNYAGMVHVRIRAC